MKVAIDLDGVIFNFNEAFSRKAVEIGVENASIIHDSNEIKLWHWPTQQQGWSRKDLDRVWRSVDETPNWWLTLKPIIGSRTVETLNQVMGLHDVWFLTNRKNGPGFSAEAQSRLALECIGVKNPRVMCVEKKGEMAQALSISLAIDDNVDNLKDYAASNVYAVCRRWNYNHDWFGANEPDLESFLKAYPFGV